MSLSKFLILLGPVSLLLASSTLATPLTRRQAASQDDIETLAQLDPVRSAVDYVGLYYSQVPATLTAIATGAEATDASFVSTSTVMRSQDVGAPPDATQGTMYQVDHIIELQFLVGAFSVNPRPTEAPTSVPADAWSSASSAIFSSKRGGFAAQSTIASSLSNLNNLEAIPNRVNGFKAQVFTGRIKSQPGNPSSNTYPTYFRKALQTLLKNRRDAMFSDLSGVGDALAANGAGNNAVVKDYFTTYAEAQYDAAVTFLDDWEGVSSVGASNARLSGGSSDTPASSVSPIAISKTSTVAASTSSAAVKSGSAGRKSSSTAVHSTSAAVKSSSP